MQVLRTGHDVGRQALFLTRKLPRPTLTAGTAGLNDARLALCRTFQSSRLDGGVSIAVLQVPPLSGRGSATLALSKRQNNRPGWNVVGLTSGHSGGVL